MTNFWSSGTGNPITGLPQDAFTKDYTTIPNDTMAKAIITAFTLEEQDTPQRGYEKYYQIKWKITNGQFKNREVTQKIKPFESDVNKVDRALNMMLLVLTLCNVKIPHQNAPSTVDLLPTLHKELGIKIREWQMEKQDGSGFSSGNWVSEVHPLEGFEESIGVPLEQPKQSTQPKHHLESALSRNAKGMPPADFDDDIMF